MTRLALMWCLLMAISAAAQEQTSKPAPVVVYKKQTEFSFEDDTIASEPLIPEGVYFEVRPKVVHSNLIAIPQNFSRKVLQSVNEL